VPRGFFVFIGPAAIVGKRLAKEELRILRRRLTGEENHHFAAHVGPLIVVPLVFRRNYAVAEEHGIGIELDVRLLFERNAYEIVQPLE
jgi:hypothetical protein